MTNNYSLMLFKMDSIILNVKKIRIYNGDIHAVVS